MISCVSITRYIPKTITPRAQYKLFKNGDHANIENIANINIATKSTINIPHLVWKSSFVKIAYTVRPKVIAKVITAATITTWLPPLSIATIAQM